MNTFPYSSDPLVNVAYGQIKRSIEVCFTNECFDAAIKLIYSGMDTMAFLGMASNKVDVTRSDFTHWADRYIHFPCKEQLTGLDLYGARCSMLHSHSSYSNLTRMGKCRIVGYMDKSVPEVRYDPNINKDFVLVSIPALAQAFFIGMDKYLIDLFSDTKRAKVAKNRLEECVNAIPMQKKPL